MIGTVVLTTGLAFTGVSLLLVAIARLLMRVDGIRFGDGPSFDDEPAWWPEFERQFADYIAGRG
jgi:hypothetical protein